MNDDVMDPVPLALLDRIVKPREQRAIESAAVLAHQGRHGEAEATRYAAGYANISERELRR